MGKEGRRGSSHLPQRRFGRAQPSCWPRTWHPALTSWSRACWKACTSPGEPSASAGSTSAAGSSGPRTGSWSAATPSWGWAGGSSGSCATSACACGGDEGQSKDLSLKHLRKIHTGIAANALLNSLPLAAALFFWDFTGTSRQHLCLTRRDGARAGASDGTVHTALTHSSVLATRSHPIRYPPRAPPPFCRSPLSITAAGIKKTPLRKEQPKFLRHIKWELSSSKSPVKFIQAAVGDWMTAETRP